MCVGNKLLNGREVIDMEILVGNHCATTVIFALADNMHARNIKSVRVAYNSANIKIMRQVFDGDFERNARFIELGNNLLVWETFEFIYKIACVCARVHKSSLATTSWIWKQASRFSFCFFR